MKYALVAGALAVVCFALFGGSGSTSEQAAELLSQYSDPKGAADPVFLLACGASMVYS